MRKKFYIRFIKSAKAGRVHGWYQFAKDRDEATRTANRSLEPGEILLSVEEQTS